VRRLGSTRMEPLVSEWLPRCWRHFGYGLAGQLSIRTRILVSNERLKFAKMECLVGNPVANCLEDSNMFNILLSIECR
jgi:hypothetical protein